MFPYVEINNDETCSSTGPIITLHCIVFPYVEINNGETCSSTGPADQCVYQNAQCIASVCACPSTMYANYNTKQCLTSKSNISVDCFSSITQLVICF